MRKRRASTVVRDNMVHEMYKTVLDDLGDLKSAVSKNYIYDMIKSKTKLSIRRISYILNHTKIDSSLL